MVIQWRIGYIGNVVMSVWLLKCAMNLARIMFNRFNAESIRPSNPCCLYCLFGGINHACEFTEICGILIVMCYYCARALKNPKYPSVECEWAQLKLGVLVSTLNCVVERMCEVVDGVYSLSMKCVCVCVIFDNLRNVRSQSSFRGFEVDPFYKGVHLLCITYNKRIVMNNRYLVDPASGICLSQRLSHASLSISYSEDETANGSVKQQ